VSIQARVEAFTEVVNVEVRLDGERLTGGPSGTGSFMVDTGDYRSGAHLLTVRAEDSLGNTAEDSVTLEFLPLPPPAPSRVWTWLRLLAAIFIGLLALIALLILLLLLLRRRSRPQVYTLEFTNRSNIPNRYKVRAEEPTGALAFEFRFQGQPLPLEQVTAAQPERAAPGPAAGSGQPGPTAAEPAGGGGGGRSGKRFSSPSQPIQKAGQAVSGVGAILSPFVALAGILATFMPSSIATPIQRWVSRVSQTQASTQSQISMGQARIDRTQQAFQRAGDQAGRVAPGQSGNGSQTAAGDSPGSSPLGGAPAAAATAVAAPAQTRATDQAAPSTRTVTTDWALTPVVDPGRSISIELLITPANPNRTQTYRFKVLSKLVGLEERPPLVEEGTVQVVGPGWFSRLARLAIFLITMLLIVALAGYGILWLLEVDLASVPLVRNWVA
jgi:hypothetical protein